MWRMCFLMCVVLMPLFVMFFEQAYFHDTVVIDSANATWNWRFPVKLPGKIADSQGRTFVVWVEKGATYKAELHGTYVDEESAKSVTRLYAARGKLTNHFYTVSLDPPVKDHFAALLALPVTVVYLVLLIRGGYSVITGIWHFFRPQKTLSLI